MWRERLRNYIKGDDFHGKTQKKMKTASGTSHTHKPERPYTYLKKIWKDHRKRAVTITPTLQHPPDTPRRATPEKYLPQEHPHNRGNGNMGNETSCLRFSRSSSRKNKRIHLGLGTVPRDLRQLFIVKKDFFIHDGVHRSVSLACLLLQEKHECDNKSTILGSLHRDVTEMWLEPTVNNLSEHDLRKDTPYAKNQPTNRKHLEVSMTSHRHRHWTWTQIGSQP